MYTSELAYICILITFNLMQLKQFETYMYTFKICYTHLCNIRVINCTIVHITSSL